MTDVLRVRLDTVLEDDNSVPYGGTAFKGETLRDFIEENDLEDYSFDKINHELISCGIKPICFKGFSKESDFENYDDYESHYYYDPINGWLSEGEYYDDGKEDAWERNQ